MARYPIILRDQTYNTLLQMAAERGLTMGKYLNQILEEAAKQVNVDFQVLQKPKIEKPCFICKHESALTLTNIKSGLIRDFCAICGKNAVESFKWKEGAWELKS